MSGRTERHSERQTDKQRERGMGMEEVGREMGTEEVRADEGKEGEGDGDGGGSSGGR